MALRALSGLGILAALAQEVCALAEGDPYLAALPSGFENVSVALVKNNLAVFPEPFDVPDLKAAFYDIQTNDTTFKGALDKIKNADFIAFDPVFLDIIGSEATSEKVLSFPGVAHVHEAPVYYPETNELIFSDTSNVGSLYSLNVDDNTVRNISLKPALSNVNGGTYHKGKVYVTTNGGPVRGIYELDPVTGVATVLVNNYRGRKLNSPNDVIADPNGNLWFTDPAYGWYNEWPYVEQPQLPNAVYFFNITSGALVAVTNNIALVPNGLALSADGTTLYVTDTNSTSGRPTISSPTSIRNVWAFDVKDNRLSNSRLIFQNEYGNPDGLRVTENGYLIVGSAFGADVVDPRTGLLLGKIHGVNDTIYNVQGVPGTGTWFLTGEKHIYKVNLKEKSLPLAG